MVTWMQTWRQVRQSWSFLRQAYDYGVSLYTGVAHPLSHRSHAMAYAVVRTTPEHHRRQGCCARAIVDKFNSRLSTLAPVVD